MGLLADVADAAEERAACLSEEAERLRTDARKEVLLWS